MNSPLRCIFHLSASGGHRDGRDLDELNELLATLEDSPAQLSDALLLSGLGDFSAERIGTFMERFTAMDLTSRRAVLQQLTILSSGALVEPVRRWLVRALAVVPLVSADSSPSHGDLDAMERAVTIFEQWDASGLGGLHRKAVIGQLKAVTETLHKPHSPEVSQRLFHIAADLAQLAGWISYDQDLPGAAQRYYLLGLSACQQAGSPILAAKILNDMAILSKSYGHYEDSLDLVQTGLYILPRAAYPQRPAESAAQQSQGLHS